MIVCCGEALIDFLPVVDREGHKAYRPVAAGSVLNVALTLGRLGAPTTFFGGLSTDFLGDLLVRALDESNVSIAGLKRIPHPTTLALVDLSTGEPAYAFYDEASACRMFDPAAAAPLGDDVTALHFGSFPLGTEPVGSRLVAMIEANAGRRVISLDPNVRPTLIADVATYSARLAAIVPLADIVKTSVADLAWLHPGVDAGEVARAWLAAGVGLVVVTQGGEGAVGATKEVRVATPAVPAAVVDTVGAGDSFMGAMLARLHERDLLDREAIRALDRESLADLLAFAAQVAAVTCSRAGADPPWRAEIATTV
jgi:fructokinase